MIENSRLGVVVEFCKNTVPVYCGNGGAEVGQVGRIGDGDLIGIGRLGIRGRLPGSDSPARSRRRPGACPSR